jgi:hypothetical protein
MVYIIDRIENSIAVCESMNDGNNIEIAVALLPKEAKEGDAIRKEGSRFTIDSALTNRRMADLTIKLDRLFSKHNS